MSRRNFVSAEQLLGPVLRSVSRSFYVSIRLLPAGLREPVGLAYLLARATDTLADTTEVAVAVRKDALRVLTSAIQKDNAGDVIADLQKSFAPLQTNEVERTLIQFLPECLQYLARTDSADREDIRAVLDKITRAQMLDIDRFGGREEVRALTSAADLHEYTYLIAGCVGEFWTQICFRHIRSFSELPKDQMFELGRRYGVGLQLINILRDTSADLRAGRCYFPGEELEAAGLQPSQILDKPEQFLPIYRKWLNEAERGVKAGMEYVSAIRHRRIRAATALPALIGARTLALLHAAGNDVLGQKIKVPRSEVRGMIGSVAVTMGSAKTLERLYRQASAGDRAMGVR